jgi:mannosyltransferase
MQIRKYLIIILLLGLALRLWGISSESYWMDEAISIKQAQARDAEAMQVIKDDINLPLYIAILHYWIKAFGTSELAVRGLSAIFGTIAIAVAYLLSRRLFNERVALISAALISVSPIMIYYSQEARSYSMFVLLSLSSFFFFVRYVQEKKSKDIAAYFACSLLMIYTHLFAFLVLVAQNAYIIYVYRFRLKRLVAWLGSQFMLILLFLPIVPNVAMNVSNRIFTSWITQPDILKVFYTIYDFFGNAVNISIFFIILAVLVYKKRFWENIEQKSSTFLLTWIIIPFAIAIACSLAVKPAYHTRYLLFTMPAFMIVFAHILDKLEPKKFSAIVLTVILVSSSASVFLQAGKDDKDDWREASSFLKASVSEGELMIVNPFYHLEALSYYHSPDCFTEIFFRSCNFRNHDIAVMDFEADCCNNDTFITAPYSVSRLGYHMNKTIWLVDVRPEAYEGSSRLLTFLSDNKELEYSHEIGDIKIYKFR